MLGCQAVALPGTEQMVWCHIKYLGQTKNRITNIFQGHIFDIKHNSNRTMAIHFQSHSDQVNLNMIIHILEYI